MEPIAIVGMACRFPGAPSLDAYWQLLSEGGDGIGPIPADRWDADALYAEDPKVAGKSNSRHGGFIEDIDRFDAGFFGISPREAIQMDPQQRILLELAYEAFEDAGIASTSLSGSDTGVYIGVMSNDYLRNQTADDYRLIDVHTGGGAGFCMLANRLSYQFDLHGPSMAIDSACSSSLVTVFQACQALWTDQIGLALAGGVNLMLDPAFNVFYAKGGLLAPDGRCKTFSANANGIGRGEGAGLVVLKRESDAVRDGDAIYAVIRGGAVNHDGRSNGVTAPNRWAQEKLLRTALRHAKVKGDELHYVELHGTGTYIGDPIEANALGAVLKEAGRTKPCLIGSVKSNVGHLEGAAGVAGLIKLALSLHHRILVPSLWFDAPNPAIDFATLPLAMNTMRRTWPTQPEDDGLLLAGISSFGLGGTNAHLVLASALPQLQTKATASAAQFGHLLVLSARSTTALRAQARQFHDLLDSDIDTAAVCMTALRRRNMHEHRLNVLGRDRHDLRQALNDFLVERPNVQALAGRFKSRRQAVIVAVPHVDTLSPARLAQWLMQAPHGRDAWQSCIELLLVSGNDRLPSLMTLANAAVPVDTTTRMLWCFAAQYAVLKQLLATLPPSLTLMPDGHGQLAASCASGSLTLSQALTWLHDGLHTSAPETSNYRVHCECAGVINPPLETLDWASEPERWKDQLAGGVSEALIVMVNVDANTLNVDALHCLGQSESDFSYLFARLGLLCPLQWPTLADDRFVRLPGYPWQRETYWLPRPTVAALQPAPVVAAPVSEPASRFRDSLLAAPISAREGLLLAYLRERVGEALQMPADDIDPAQPLNMLGMDSLTAVEIKNRIERDLGVAIPVVKFLDGFAVADFAMLIIGDLDGATVAKPQPEHNAVVLTDRLAAPNVSGDIHNQVAAMSVDQIDDMLAQLMS